MINSPSLLDDMRLTIIREQMEKVYVSDNISDLEKISRLIPWLLEMIKTMYDLQKLTSRPPSSVFTDQFNEDPVFPSPVTE